MYMFGEKLAEITEKIKSQTMPTDKDKERLLFQINRQLTEEDHYYIFTEFLQTMEHKIYTVTENGTLFDLNDLSPDTFWKLTYHVQLFIDTHQREEQTDKIKLENDLLTEQFTQKNLQQLKQFQHEHTDDHPDTSGDNYEKLRLDALRQCSYSNFATGLTDNRSPESSVYSDNVMFKWKQSSRSDELNKRIQKISSHINQGNIPKPRPAPIPKMEGIIDDIDDVEGDVNAETDANADANTDAETDTDDDDVDADADADDDDDIVSMTGSQPQLQPLPQPLCQNIIVKKQIPKGKIQLALKHTT